MKNNINYLYFLLMLVTGCEMKPDNKRVNSGDSVVLKKEETSVIDTMLRDTTHIYSNARFKDVVVEKTSDQTFLVKGKAQVFEAAFSWVIEDGHNEIDKGFEMTDAGAPEWGKFEFKITAIKKDPNATLHLVLFESSPKDGSRQYELPIKLY